MTADLERLGRRFFLGANEFAASPLYQRLCVAIARDQDSLTIAAACRGGQQPPNLFLAAVHFLLLSGVGHELGLYYPSVVESARDADGVEPVFRSFCRENRDALIDLVSRRLVQTNVVKRSAALRLGLAIVARRHHGPIALLEIGGSAGVHLCFDRYQYEIAGRVWGVPGAAVQIVSEWRGGAPPPDLDRLPPIASRVGVDLNPIDATDPVQRRWLHALVWPENRHEADLLDQALAAVASDPPPMVAGDALEVCPRLVRDLPSGQALAVFHAATRAHVPQTQRARFDETIAALGRDRPLFWLSLEAPHRLQSRPTPSVPSHMLVLQSIDGDQRTAEDLALVEPHADWIEPCNF